MNGIISPTQNRGFITCGILPQYPSKTGQQFYTNHQHYFPMEPIELLSQREREVAKLLMQGMSNKQIALQLGISERTVEFHLNNSYTKLGAGSRLELAIILWKTTGGDLHPKPVESTVDSREESTHNGNQPVSQMRWATSLKNTSSLIKQEIAMTGKIALEEIGNYFRTRPFFTSLLLVSVAGFIARYLIVSYGLYFWVSYALLGLILGLGSIYLGLSWDGIKSGNIHIRPAFLVGILLFPVLVAVVDLSLLNTLGRYYGQVAVNMPGISNKAMWLLTPNGEPYLALQRSITKDELWLIGSLLYMALLSIGGKLLSKQFKGKDLSPA